MGQPVFKMTQFDRFAVELKSLLGVSLCLAAASASAANFQDVLPGARPQGMGLAYTAVAEGPIGILYNPAAMAGTTPLEVSFSVNRMLGPVDPLAGVFAGYSRPLLDFPFLKQTPPGATASAVFYSVRQRDVAKKDTLLINYAGLLTLPNMPVPLQWGVSTRFVSFRRAGRDRLGFGIDGGVLAKGPEGLSLGLSVTDLLLPDLDLPTPFITFGLAYPFWDHFLFAFDYRFRRGNSGFFPGIEVQTLSGLVNLRAGKGLPWSGKSQLAFGVGLNYSPLILDVALTLPPSGLNEAVGSYQVSLSYRFGAMPFYTLFVGRNTEQVAQLKIEIEGLQDRRTLLQQKISQAQANKSELEGEIRNLEFRLEEIRIRLAQLPKRVAKDRTKLKPSKAAPVRKPKPRAPVWPRTHVVQSGETLRSIADRYYGNRILWEIIYKANPERVERGLPRIGSKLVIPKPP